MKINFKNTIVIIALAALQISFAQKKEENIGTEVVNVVKPYTPTISDAFKIKEIPVLDDEGNSKKEIIKYSFFSFPVASTFTPSKGKSIGVEKEKQAHYYDNYATFGVGNYGVLNAELFINQELGNDDYIGGMLRHLSSQGGIDGVELENSFYDTSIDLTYGVSNRDLFWNIDLGYQNQIYNWYGLPADFGSTLTVADKNLLIDTINPKQSYSNMYLGGKIEFNENFLREGMLKFNHFSDDFGSSENRFYAKPTLEFDVDNLVINTNVIIDYLGGSFEKNYSNTSDIKYTFTNVGVAPSFVMQEDDWTFKIGAGLYYSADSQNSKSKFFVYPQIDASYKVVGDLMIFYAGAEGDLKQNTYSDFVNVNPFLSPTLAISPTDKKYDLFGGLKGKLADNVSYNIRASYLNESNKALFKSNDYTENSSNENYAFGNSMQVVYDDMSTVNFYGELKADLSEDITFGIDGTFNSYTNKFQIEAWNLPTMKLAANADFNITERWFTGVNVFFVGDRKDQKINTNITPSSPVTLDSYFDLNAHVGFKYNDRFTAFLRMNNITNNGYEKWLDYPVQVFQAVIGANYKFDF